MKVCTYNGIDVVVLIRNEHCPPHVHAGTKDWDARFKFSFWHNGVDHWDVRPRENAPKTGVIEGLRATLEQPKNLEKARKLWWRALGTVCLDNKYLDPESYEVLDGKEAKEGMPSIHSSSFDEARYRTCFHISGDDEPLEFEL